MSDSVETYLQSLAGVPLKISWHENKSSYLSFRKERAKVSLRLHKLFRDAPAPVLDALARYLLKNDKSAKPLLRKTVHSYFTTKRAAPDSLYTSGLVYDLKSIYEKIKGLFFTPDYDAAIGWSTSSRKTKFRHITFGTYDRHRHQIRIHPFLDNEGVPPYFVEFIVYHEMLHAVCGPQIDDRGYSRSHTREFRQREKLFPQYDAAKRWEQGSLMFFKRGLYGRT